MSIGFVAKSGWQTHWHKHPAVRSGDELTRGERAADRMRNVMGSWPFVFCFFGVMIICRVAGGLEYAKKGRWREQAESTHGPSRQSRSSRLASTTW